MLFGPSEYTKQDAIRDLLAFADMTGIAADGTPTRRPGPRTAPKFWRYRVARMLMLELRGVRLDHEHAGELREELRDEGP